MVPKNIYIYKIKNKELHEDKKKTHTHTQNNRFSVITGYLKSHCDKDDFTFVFIKKTVKEKEIKLKEFNYKLLHGILPCNKKSHEMEN